MVYRLVPVHNAPYPEIAEKDANDEPYDVTDSRNRPYLPSVGMTSKEHRRLTCPFDKESHHVALHEMAHVIWSPEILPKVRFDRRVLLAVEDARINMGLAWLGKALDLSIGDRAIVSSLGAKDLERGDTAMYILRCVASLGTDAWDPLLEQSREKSKAIYDMTTGILGRIHDALVKGRRKEDGPVAKFSVVHEQARRLARLLEAHGMIDRSGSGKTIDCGGAGCVLCDHEGPERRLLEGTGKRRVRGGLVPPGARNGSVPPGHMKMAVAPMTTPVERSRQARKRAYRPSAEGSIATNMYRYAIDRAVFRRPKRVAGGTVLIDTSGSMSLDADDIDRIVRDAAFAPLIAIYSGSGDKGELRIVARKGRRTSAKHLEPYGGGNIIDEPALEWLSTQSEPRIWISDGGVTGVGDTACPEMKERCKALCRRSRIKLVRSIEKAAGLISGKRGDAVPADASKKRKKARRKKPGSERVHV